MMFGVRRHFRVGVTFQTTCGGQELSDDRLTLNPTEDTPAGLHVTFI